MNIHKPSHVKTSLPNSDIGMKALWSRLGWRGTCPLHPGLLFRQPLDDAWIKKTLPDEEKSHTHI